MALPPPPPAPTFQGQPPRTAPPQRPWQLTMGWRLVLGLGWAGVIVGIGALWNSARVMGLSPWWLGPQSSPRLFAIQLMPFIAPVVMLILIGRNLRYLPFYGMIAAIVLAAIGTGDLGRFNGIAAVELAIAASGFLVSAASFAGVLRPAPGSEPRSAIAGPMSPPQAWSGAVPPPPVGVAARPSATVPAPPSATVPAPPSMP